MKYPDDFINKIICGDCLEVMKEMPDECVDLVITSPPYYNLKSYSHWNTYHAYLKDVQNWFKQLSKVLKTGRHICWVIQDNIPNPLKNGRHYFPLMPDTIKIALNYGFEWEMNIIWNKNNEAQMLFGSYPYPPNIIYSCITESICIFRKLGKTNLKNKTENSKFSRDFWIKNKRNLWNIASAINQQHPAPFPMNIPLKLIQLHSFLNDLILDPFIGSGTTARACKDLKRNFIGIEINLDYCKIAEERLAQGVL